MESLVSPSFYVSSTHSDGRYGERAPGTNGEVSDLLVRNDGAESPAALPTYLLPAVPPTAGGDDAQQSGQLSDVSPFLDYTTRRAAESTGQLSREPTQGVPRTTGEFGRERR